MDGLLRKTFKGTWHRKCPSGQIPTRMRFNRPFSELWNWTTDFLSLILDGRLLHFVLPAPLEFRTLEKKREFPKETGIPMGKLQIANRALVTSGSYEKYFLRDGM